STHRENRAPSRPRNSIRLKNVDGPDRECWVRQTTVRVAAFENDTRLQRILCGRTETIQVHGRAAYRMVPRALPLGSGDHSRSLGEKVPAHRVPRGFLDRDTNCATERARLHRPGKRPPQLDPYNPRRLGGLARRVSGDVPPP